MNKLKLIEARAVILWICLFWVAGAATPAFSASLKGTVVDYNLKAHSFVIATPHAALLSIHSNRRPKIGSKVSIVGRKLLNGTYAAKKITVNKSQSRHVRVRVHGTVSHASGSSFTLSANGASLKINLASAQGAVTGQSTDLPIVGNMLDETVDLNQNGDCDEQDRTDLGEDTDGFEMGGVILAIDTVARTISISSDENDDEESGVVDINVPDTIDLSKFAVGDSIDAKVTVNPDGTFTLVGIGQNGDAQSADDSNDSEGDNNGEGNNNGGDNNSGDNHSND